MIRLDHFLIVLLATFVNSGHIVFYKNAKYKGDVLGNFTIVPDCTNVAEAIATETNSLTTTECVSVFADKDCNEFKASIQFNSKSKFVQDKYSFRQCQNLDEKFSVNFVNTKDKNSSNITVENGECYPRKYSLTEKMKTEECLMVYTNQYCSGAALQVFGDFEAKKSIQVGGNSIWSFRVCRPQDRLNHVEVAFFNKTAVPDEISGNAQIHKMLGHRGCNIIPSWIINQNVEIMWSDSCILIYGEPDCQKNALSLKLNRGELGDLNIVGIGKSRTLSYRPCTSMEGGDNAIIEFLEGGRKKHSFEASEMCGCKEVELSGFDEYEEEEIIVQVRNHGTCLRLFEDSQCTNWLSTIPAGTNSKSLDLVKEEKYGGTVTASLSQARSVNLCELPKSCVVLNIFPYKIKLVADNLTNDYIASIATEQKEPNRDVVFNNGTANITKTFTFTKNLTMVLTIMRSEDMPVVDVGNLTIESSPNFPKVISLDFVKELIKSHYYANMSGVEVSSKTLSNETSKTDQKMLLITRTFKIPHCTNVAIQHVVKYVDKLPIPFEVFAKVNGTMRSSPETVAPASLLKDMLPHDMEYVDTLDDNTIIAKSPGKLYASFGFRAVINTNETQILECGKGGEKCDDDEVIVEFEAISY